MTLRRMRIACWINRATDTHSEYVLLIAFPLQQWLREHVSVLRYMCIACRILYMACSPLLVSQVYLEHSWNCFVLMAFCAGS